MWRTRIQLGGKKTSLGYFDDESKAARAYDDCVVEHKLGRPLNFPQPESIIRKGRKLKAKANAVEEAAGDHVATSSAASPIAVYRTVAPDETLRSIGAKLNISPQLLLQLNKSAHPGLTMSARLYNDTRIFLDDAGAMQAAEEEKEEGAPRAAEDEDEDEVEGRLEAGDEGSLRRTASPRSSSSSSAKTTKKAKKKKRKRGSAGRGGSGEEDQYDDEEVEAMPGVSSKAMSSKFRGVFWQKNRNKWQVGCRIDGTRRYVGLFSDELAAARAHDAFAIANKSRTPLNFPGDEAAAGHVVEKHTRRVAARESSSRFRGVCWIKRDKKWRAEIGLADGRKKYIGNFATEMESAHAYDAYAVANRINKPLNFPDEHEEAKVLAEADGEFYFIRSYD